MYDTHEVVPEQVDVSLTTPVPRSGFSHTDIPEFRGVGRRNAPAWLLYCTAIPTAKCSPDDEVRLSLSWKAKVYADADERRRAEGGVDGLSVDQALDRLEADLANSDRPEPLEARSVESSELRAQLAGRYSAYSPTPAPPAESSSAMRDRVRRAVGDWRRRPPATHSGGGADQRPN